MSVLGIFDSSEPEPWMSEGLCAQTDPELFFPDRGGSSREAKKICYGYEVRLECLQHALDKRERYGIWGGLSERERAKLKRRQAALIAATGPLELDAGLAHGTPGGYGAGCKCLPCRTADRYHQRYVRRGTEGGAA